MGEVGVCKQNTHRVVTLVWVQMTLVLETLALCLVTQVMKMMRTCPTLFKRSREILKGPQEEKAKRIRICTSPDSKVSRKY